MPQRSVGWWPKGLLWRRQLDRLNGREGREAESLPLDWKPRSSRGTPTTFDQRLLLDQERTLGTTVLHRLARLGDRSRS
jgi:hypothetical protein